MLECKAGLGKIEDWEVVYCEGIGCLKTREGGNSLNEISAHIYILLRDRLDCEHKSQPVISPVLAESLKPRLHSHWHMA